MYSREGRLVCILEGFPASSVGDVGQVARWKWANQGRQESRPGMR